MKEFEMANFSLCPPPLFSPSRIIVNKRLEKHHETENYNKCVVNLCAYWQEKELNVMKSLIILI